MEMTVASVYQLASILTTGNSQQQYGSFSWTGSLFQGMIQATVSLTSPPSSTVCTPHPPPLGSPHHHYMGLDPGLLEELEREKSSSCSARPSAPRKQSEVRGTSSSSSAWVFHTGLWLGAGRKAGRPSLCHPHACWAAGAPETGNISSL